MFRFSLCVSIALVAVKVSLCLLETHDRAGHTASESCSAQSSEDRKVDQTTSLVAVKKDAMHGLKAKPDEKPRSNFVPMIPEDPSRGPVCLARESSPMYNVLLNENGEGGHCCKEDGEKTYNPTPWVKTLPSPGMGGPFDITDNDQPLSDILHKIHGKYVLFRGGDAASLPRILSQGFDMEFSEKNQLGYGLYLTASPNEAKNYACQNSRAAHSAILMFEVKNAEQLMGYTLTGFKFTRMIQTSSPWFQQTMKQKASFVRLRGKPNQFAFKCCGSIDEGHPIADLRLLSAVVVGKGYYEPYHSNELKIDEFRSSSSYYKSCSGALKVLDEEALQEFRFADAGVSPCTETPDWIKNWEAYEGDSVTLCGSKNGKDFPRATGGTFGCPER